MRDLDLRMEGPALVLRLGRIPVEIQAGLADRPDLFVAGQLADVGRRFGVVSVGVVRVPADRRVDPFEVLGRAICSRLLASSSPTVSNRVTPAAEARPRISSG